MREKTRTAKPTIRVMSCSRWAGRRKALSEPEAVLDCCSGLGAGTLVFHSQQQAPSTEQPEVTAPQLEI